jgi:hypothetical protein
MLALVIQLLNQAYQKIHSFSHKKLESEEIDKEFKNYSKDNYKIVKRIAKLIIFKCQKKVHSMNFISFNQFIANNKNKN